MEQLDGVGEIQRFLGRFWDKLDFDINGKLPPSCFCDLKWGFVDDFLLVLAHSAVELLTSTSRRIGIVKLECNPLDHVS